MKKTSISSKMSKPRLDEEVLLSQLKLQEQALEQISQEIHDNIGQALTFVKLNLNTIDIDKHEETKKKLSEASALVSVAIRDLRNLSKVLNTEYINNVGLVKSIQYQLDYLDRTGIYKTKLHFSEEVYSLLPEVEIILFRVVQELLNNIVRHADATTIDIYLEYHPEELIMKIADNGKGFSIGLQQNKSLVKGLGLTTMQKRLAHIRGRIEIESESGRGTQVKVFVSRSTIPSIEYQSYMCV